ncbi:hypothetical protein S83_017485 [Arachis hypogaea]
MIAASSEDYSRDGSSRVKFREERRQPPTTPVRFLNDSGGKSFGGANQGLTAVGTAAVKAQQQQRPGAEATPHAMVTMTASPPPRALFLLHPWLWFALPSVRSSVFDAAQGRSAATTRSPATIRGCTTVPSPSQSWLALKLSPMAPSANALSLSLHGSTTTRRRR